MNSYPLERQVQIPVACDVLHNFIHMNQQDDDLMTMYRRDAVPIDEIDPSNQADAIPSQHLNVDVGGPNEGVASVSYGDMNAYREFLTNQMAEAHNQRPWCR